MSDHSPSVTDLFARAQVSCDARRMGEAEQLYRRVLDIDNRHAGSWHGRGVIALAYGRPDAAAGFIGKAILIDADNASHHALLGKALERLGRLADAVASFERALILQADPDTYISLGAVWGRLGKLDAAVGCFEKALVFDPASEAARYNLGLSFERKNDLTAAAACFEQVLDARPESVEVLNSLGRVLFALKRVDAALTVLDQAVALMPGHADAWNNRGTALLQADRLDESLQSYDRALAVNPGHPMAWFNRGNTLVRLKRLDDALASFARVQALAPDFIHGHFGESLCRLRAGDFRGGWRKYEWRSHIRPDLMRVLPTPPWSAAHDIDGKTILLHAEQGFGDVLQFCRYVPLVAACGARVVLEVPPVLKRLMTTLDGVAALYAQGEALPDVDAHCPLLSLPLAFDTVLETIPARIPYLAASEETMTAWRARLEKIPRPRIGLVWSGRTGLLGEMHRAITPAQLAPLLACGATVVSLQKEYRPEDRAWLAAHPQVRDFSEDLGDFADTAALAGLMDVIITIDTSVAHLAGALGLPVWIMLSHIGDWRWMENRDDSPWYPTARLYRQSAINDWDSVIARVAVDFRKHMASS